MNCFGRSTTSYFKNIYSTLSYSCTLALFFRDLFWRMGTTLMSSSQNSVLCNLLHQPRLLTSIILLQQAFDLSNVVLDGLAASHSSQNWYDTLMNWCSGFVVKTVWNQGAECMLSTTKYCTPGFSLGLSIILLCTFLGSLWVGGKKIAV